MSNLRIVMVVNRFFLCSPKAILLLKSIKLSKKRPGVAHSFKQKTIEQNCIEEEGIKLGGGDSC